MKRSLFIIIGGVLIVVLLAVWVWVLFFSTPDAAEDQYSDLNIGDTTDTTFVPGEDTGEQADETPVNVTGTERLKQLTTKPVAGYGEVTLDSVPQEVRYVEVGTGHIYSIDLETGEEVRISGTTVPTSQIASFAGNSEYVMMQSGYGVGANFVVGTLSTSSDQLRTSTLAEDIISFKGTQSGEFLYAVQTNNSVIGRAYNPTTLTSRNLFTIPFRDVTINWGSEASDSHYVYPKTSSQLESFLYEVRNGVLSRLPIDGYGMSAEGNNSYIVYSRQTEDDYATYQYNKSTNALSEYPLTQIPEKCTSSYESESLTICANTGIVYNETMPDTWYTGETSFQDSLYEISNDVSRSLLLVNTQRESGRNLDIQHLQIGVQDALIYFTNKNDRSLWMYERTPLILLDNLID